MKKIYLLYCLFALAFASCQKEEISIEKSNLEKDLSIQEVPFESLPPLIINFFKKEGFQKGKETTRDFGKFGVVNASKKVIIAANEENKSTYTFALKKVEHSHNSGRYFDNLVVTYIGEEMMKITILRSRPESNSINKKSKSFNGTIEFYSPNGDKLGSMQLEGGEQIDFKSSQKNYTTTCTYEFESEICSGSGSTERCLITYNENCTTSYTPAPDREYDGGGGESTTGSGSGSTSTTTSPIPDEEEVMDEEEDKIDDSELKGKEKCLNDLLDKSGNSFVKELLAHFKGDGTEFDIKIISKIRFGRKIPKNS